MSDIFRYLPLVVAPAILIIFSLVTAYVFKFGLPKSGINADYILFTIVVVLALILGGVI